MTTSWIVVAALLGPSAAVAAPKSLEDVVAKFLPQLALTSSTEVDHGTLRVGLLDRSTLVDAPYPEYGQGYDAYFDIKQQVIGWSADKHAAWVTADLPEIAGGMGGTTPSVIATAHGSAVFVQRGGAWHAVAFAVRSTVPDKEQADILKDGTTPPALERKIDAGAQDAAKLFESTLATPKALAASVSDRSEVVLQGSDTGDRAHGGKAVAALLLKWNLRLTARDGVQAGLAGDSLAWVAANVDAVPASAKPGTKPVPYQLFVVYEKTGAAWKLVAMTFAFFTGH